MSYKFRLITTSFFLGVFLMPFSASASVLISAGGRVVGPTGVCLQLDGGVGELFHLLPDARIVPLIPPDYIWSPTTITVPVPERPPVIGQEVLGLVYPSPAFCITKIFPFFRVAGWKFVYIGESPI